MRGSMISLCFRTATLAIASTVFMAGAQQQADEFRVSDNTAGGSAFWNNGFLTVSQGFDVAAGKPADLVDLGLFYGLVSIIIECAPPASAVTTKSFNSISFQVADISTCDGGRFIFPPNAVDCSGVTCIAIPVPHWAVTATWTKYGVRTLQQSGTVKQVIQDFNGNILSSTQSSGIRTSYDASFVVNVNGESVQGLSQIVFSKGVTITFSPN
jgi:hypothetical protein